MIYHHIRTIFDGGVELLWVCACRQCKYRLKPKVRVPVVIWLALAGLSRLRRPRWSLAVVTGILALGCMALRLAYAGKPIFVVPHANHIEVIGPAVVFLFSILWATFGISALLLLPSVAVGRIATRDGSRRDGDVAMTIFASFAIGQFMPLCY